MTKHSLTSALLAGLFASVAAAQSSSVGPRWAAYQGCWQETPVEGQLFASNNTLVCVVPSGATGADLVSIVDNKVTERTHVDADGAHHDVTRQGCTGWESGAWSSDGRRLYLDSDQQCAGLHRVSSGVFAIGTGGQWTNVVNVNAGGGSALRVARYSSVSVDSTLPADVRSALSGSDMAIGAARVAAESRVTIDNVVEASRFLNAAVVQAWLASSGEAFTLDAKTLVHLADAGVPPATIDVMIAVSNPTVFAVVPQPSGVMANQTPAPRTQTALRQDCYSSAMDPWGYSDYADCDPYGRRYGYGYGYGRSIYDPYGYYGYSPYGYGGYGYGYGFGYGYNGSPIIVVTGSSNPATPHGRMTKNGYVNSGGSTQATSSPNDGSAPRATAPTSSSGSGSGSGSGSSGGSSSSGRTAQRKPPAK